MIIVTKSSPVVVVPSTTPATPTTKEQIKLTSFDKPLAFSPFTSFLVFDHAIHKPAETIKNALSRALVPYFLLAGRTVVDANDGEFRISCTGEGVPFVSASTNCSLDAVKLFDPPFSELLRELAIDYPDSTRRRPSDPLLLVQVTEFSGGGFVVGTTWDHGIADGMGMAQFLQAVGDHARGLQLPTIFPVSCGDGSLPELPPWVIAMEKAMVTLEPQGFVYQDITVPWKLVNRVKAEFAATGHDHDGGPCTVFEAVVAVLWRCRTRVVVPDADAPAPLVIAANVRRHVGAKDGYFGNCITSAVTVPRSGDVANGGGISDVVRLIRRAKQGIPGQFVGGAAAAAVAGEEGAHHAGPTKDVLFGYSAFFVSSWRNLGFDAADFGSGRPSRVMCQVGMKSVPNCVACLPCAAKDGANVLALCVREVHADAFIRELEMF
ncbi:unnamed protein product [Urochloa humidicola]